LLSGNLSRIGKETTSSRLNVARATAGGRDGGRQPWSVQSSMEAKVLRVDERLATLGADVRPFPRVRSTHVRLHVRHPRERLSADRTQYAAGVLTSVVAELAQRFDLLAAQLALVHVADDVQPMMLVERAATDEPATAHLALVGPVAGVCSTVDAQQVSAYEGPTTQVASERLWDLPAGAVESVHVDAHGALLGECLEADGAWHSTPRPRDGPSVDVLRSRGIRHIG